MLSSTRFGGRGGGGSQKNKICSAALPLLHAPTATAPLRQPGGRATRERDALLSSFKGAPRHAAQEGWKDERPSDYKDEHGIWRGREHSAQGGPAGLGPGMQLIPLLSLPLFWAR